jgi:hypothetical protein
MPHGSTRVCIAALLTFTAALAASAPATANWTTNGTATGSPFSGSAPSTRWQFHTPGISSNIECAPSSLTGLLFGPSLASGSGIASVLPAYSNCSAGSIFLHAMKCSAEPLNGITYTAGTATTAAALGIRCIIVKTNGACGNATTFTGGGITLSGQVPVTYGNTSQSMTVSPTGQTLAATWSVNACLGFGIPGPASVTLTNTSGTALVYGLTSTFRPQITN